jgi:PAS domain S-box-containing protein
MSAPSILIVEDEVIVAMELKSRLTSLGYVVVGTEGYGEDAVKTATARKPDLLLMDITLAGDIDGIEAARIIHETQDIPVIYLTAHSDEQTLQKAKQGDPFAYLVKPFTESSLRTAIEVALHKHAKDRQARSTAEWFSQTVNSLRGAAIGTDEHGIVRHINRLAETFTEFSEADAIGKHPHDVLTVKQSPDGAIMQDLCLSDCEAGPASRSFDCVIVSRNGKEVPIELTILASGDSRRRDRALIFAFREITQQVTPNQDWFSWTANLRIAGALCKRERRLRDAESFFRRALDILETHLGTDNRKLTPLLDELSDICGAVGKDGDAHMLRLRAQRIRSRSDLNRDLTVIANDNMHYQPLSPAEPAVAGL